MKKIFTKLFLLTTLLMVSSELWAQDYWLVLNNPGPLKVQSSIPKDFYFDLVGPANWVNFFLESESPRTFHVFGQVSGGSKWERIAYNKKGKNEEFTYNIEGKGYTRILITLTNMGTSSASLKNVKAGYAYGDVYLHRFGSAEYNSAEESTSFTIDYYGTPKFTWSYESGSSDQFPVEISASGGKATVTVKYLHKEAGNHQATIIISNGVFKAPYNFHGTTTKATPTVTAWPTIAPVTYGTNLGTALVLKGGSASVAGTFVITSSYTAATVPNAGTYTYNLEFRPTETNKYNVVSGGTATLTVNKANQTIAWTATPPTEMTVGDSHTLSATALGGAVSYDISGEAATLAGNTLTAVQAGTVTITASQAGNGNYNTAANVTHSITINKATPTVTAWPTLNAVTYGTNLGDALQLKGGSASVAGTFVITSSYTAATVPNAGTYTYNLEFRPTESNKYNNVSGGTATLTVNKANQTITWDMGNQSMYVGGQLTLNATASSTLGVTYTSSNTSVVTVSGNTLTAVGEGNATITASQAGNSNYNAATDITYTVSVSKKDQTITWTPPTEMTVGDTHTLSATATSGDAVAFAISGDAATLAGNTLTAVQAGTVTITASQAGNSNYNAAADITYTVSVSKATPTVTAWPTLDAVTYGATLEQALVLVGGTASVAGTFAITDSYNAADVPNAGTHTYNVTFTPSETNKYNIVSGGTATLVVNKADQVLTWSFADCTLLPGQTLALDATSTCGVVSYELTGSAISVSGNTLTAEAAGTATIKAVDAGNSNYNAVESSVYTVTVSESGYTRAVTNGNYGTICLPYGSSSYAGAEFYEIAYAEIKDGDATGLYLDQIEEDAALVAGKPYIFKATADILIVTYEGTIVDAPVAGEAGLTGTFVDIAAGGVLVGNYIIAQNMFWDASTENYLNANRAYINKATLLSVEPKSLVPGRRRVSMGETGENAATDVENTQLPMINSQKLIENGQLIIIRDGVKYNAMGVKL